jgi:hypothetical protein
MVSPYLLRPLRSLQEAVEGARTRAKARDRMRAKARDRAQAPPPRPMLKAEGPGVQFWDARPPTGPRLVWTNAAREPDRRP